MDPSKPIAMAGFMGVGKSTLGRRLASELERPFHDTDDLVERSSGRTIPDFFGSGEEDLFRRLEAGAVRELLARGPVVIGLGGGALMDQESRRLLERESVLIHVHMPWPELRARLDSLAATRPLLQGRSAQEIHRLYLSRLPTYGGAAIAVTVHGDSTDEALEEILRRLAVRPEL